MFTSMTNFLMAMPLHVREKSKWRPIKLPEDVLNREDFTGLVDIQELTDYELVPFEGDISDPETDKKGKIKSRKRKGQNEVKEKIAEELEKGPPRKKKRRRKKSVSLSLEADNKQDIDNEQCTFSSTQLDITSKNTSTLQRKSNVKEANNVGVKRKLTQNKKLNAWIVSSKDVEVVSGDNIVESLNDNTDGTNESTSNRKTKSKRRKRKKIKAIDSTQENDSGPKIADDAVKTTKISKLGKNLKKKNMRQQEDLSQDELSLENSNVDLKGGQTNSEPAATVDMSEWKGLFVPGEVLKALQDQNFATPTVIQREALPSAIRDRKDILGAAETGSGKTLAFGIPLISRILDAKRVARNDEDEIEAEDKDSGSDEDIEGNISSKELHKKPPMALILEPTRELAVQVQKHLKAVCKYTNIKCANVVGGMSVEKQRRILSKSPEIVIATPGRLWQLIEEGNDHLCQIDRTLCLVLDEADRMVEKGHYEELTKLLELMNKSPRRVKNRQTFVMSATLTMDISAPKRLMNKGKKYHKEEDKIESLIEKTCISGKPKVIDLTPAVKVAQTLTELRINCKADEKDFYLYYFLCQHPGRTLVFANSKDCLRRLVAVFTLLQCSPLPLHADMHQRQRLKNLDRFSENTQALLVASDVAARGLDIPGVDHVIHYQVPRTMENYVHRSGRTARASNLGLSVMFVGPEDAKDYRKIIHGVRSGEDLPLLPIEMDLMPAVKQRVNLAKEVDVKEYRMKKKKIKNNFFIKAAEEMDMIIDDDRLLENLGDHVEQAEEKQQMAQMKTRLAQVLRGSLAPLRMTKYPTKSGQLATKSVINLLAR